MAAQSNSQSISPQQANMMARQLILRGGMIGNKYQPPALDVWQPQNPVLPSNPGLGSVITMYVRNVGLVKRLVLQFTATVTAGSGALTLTKLGLANFISNVTFYDLGNNQRINTSGWHLTAISSAKRRRPFGAAVTTDTPLGYGNNNNRVMYAPASIAASGSSEVDFVLEIPFVKNDNDLRGAIFADVTQATMQVQVTVNPNFFVSNTADPTLAVYQSATGVLGTLSNLTVQMYQNYLDALPRDPGNGVPILPPIDLGTAYLLNTTASGLPVANQDNGISFINAREYESVAFVYDNNGTLNVNGSDINYISLQSANFTNILNLNGKMAGLMQRNIMADDFPAGMYYLDFRHRPINTNQYGNMQLVINPASVGGSGAVFLLGWEAYAVIGLVNQGGSLPMGAG